MNVAELISLCADKPGRRVLNAVDRDNLSVAEIAHTIFETMGRDCRDRHVSRAAGRESRLDAVVGRASAGHEHGCGDGRARLPAAGELRGCGGRGHRLGHAGGGGRRAPRGELAGCVPQHGHALEGRRMVRLRRRRTSISPAARPSTTEPGSRRVSARTRAGRGRPCASPRAQRGGMRASRRRSTSRPRR